MEACPIFVVLQYCFLKTFVFGVWTAQYAIKLRVHSFGMICIRINNPRYYRSWHTVEEPLNSLLARIRQFHWCTMIQVIFNHWFDHHKGIHSENYCHVWIQTTGLFPFLRYFVKHSPFFLCLVSISSGHFCSKTESKMAKNFV